MNGRSKSYSEALITAREKIEIAASEMYEVDVIVIRITSNNKLFDKYDTSISVNGKEI